MKVVTNSQHPESDVTQTSRGNVPGRSQVVSVEAVAAIAIIFLAAVVRMAFVPLQNITWDELYELQMLSPNIGDLITRSDGFPPLFPILFSAWNKFVTGDNSARWFSVFVSVVSLFPLWILAKSIGKDVPQHSTGVANHLTFYVLFFACLNPLHHYFSTEGRAYALMLMLAIASVVFGLRAIDSNRLSDWLAFAVTGLMGVYTHYYSLFAGVLVFAILLIERKPRATLRRALKFAAAIAVGLIPLLWVFRSDLEAQVDYAGYAGFSVLDIGYTYYSYISGFCIGPSLRALHSLPREEAIGDFAPWVLLLGAAAMFLFWQGSRMLSRRWKIRLFLWATIPVAMSAFARFLLDVNYNVRYTIPSWAPVIFWLAAGASTWWLAVGWRRWCTLLASSVLIGASCFSLFNRAVIDDFRNADFRTIANVIETNSKRGTTVFVNSWYQHYPLQHYLSDEWVVTPARTDIDDPQKYGEAKSLVDSVPLGESFIFVYSREFHGDHDRSLLKHIQKSRSIQFVGRAAGVEAFFFPGLSDQ